MQQARIYQGLDDYQRAVSAIKKADSIGILSTWQWMQAGKIYEWGGEIQNAINAYRQALKIMPENTQAEKYLELIQAEGGK